MDKQLDDLKTIREMMEKSTKFLSLSGLSGIVAGFTAIVGASFAWFYIFADVTRYTPSERIMWLLADALTVLVITLFFGVYFSVKKARGQNQKIVTKVAAKTLYNLALPLVAGGLFSLVYLFRGNVDIVIASTLLFYGLALINVSKFTFEEIHYLGITEIVLAILSAVFPKYGILFWTLGFGVSHILYGTVMYLKYDVRK